MPRSMVRNTWSAGNYSVSLEGATENTEGERGILDGVTQRRKGAKGRLWLIEALKDAIRMHSSAGEVPQVLRAIQAVVLLPLSLAVFHCEGCERREGRGGR
jgi:hypothetical protein